MSDKTRRKKDGEDKNKNNQRMREAEGKEDRQNTADRRRGIDDSGINRKQT